MLKNSPGLLRILKNLCDVNVRSARTVMLIFANDIFLMIPFLTSTEKKIHIKLFKRSNI